MRARPAAVLAGGGRSFGITQEQLSTHCLLLGATGSGKTNAILHLIRQLKASMGLQDAMLVFDSKLGFHPVPQRRGPCDHKPADRRRKQRRLEHFRRPCRGRLDEEAIALNADEIAQVVFSDSIAHSSQPFFPTAARDVFAAVLKGMAFMGASDAAYRARCLH